MNKKGLRNSVEWYPVEISGKTVVILQPAWNIVWWQKSMHNLDDNSKKCYLLIIFPLNYFLFLPEMKPGNHFQSEKIPSYISTNISKRNILVSMTIKSMQKVQTERKMYNLFIIEEKLWLNCNVMMYCLSYFTLSSFVHKFADLFLLFAVCP
jgi:hypothetical protein